MFKQNSAKMTFNQFIEIKISKPHNTHMIQTRKGKKKQLQWQHSLLLYYDKYKWKFLGK
jgi:tRNA1(Val) A37 N6-methylase TrmN6